MKICDRCETNKPAAFTVLVEEEGQSFDLCESHKNEVVEFIATKQKKTLFGRKKNAAKAG